MEPKRITEGNLILSSHIAHSLEEIYKDESESSLRRISFNKPEGRRACEFLECVPSGRGFYMPTSQLIVRPTGHENFLGLSG